MNITNKPYNGPLDSSAEPSTEETGGKKHGLFLITVEAVNPLTSHEQIILY